MNKSLFLWAVGLFAFSSMYGQSVSISAVDTFICDPADGIALSLAISGGTPVSIEWVNGRSSVTSMRTDTVWYPDGPGAHWMTARVDFGGSVVSAQLEVFVGALELYDVYPKVEYNGSCGLYLDIDSDLESVHSSIPFKYQLEIKGPGNYYRRSMGQSLDPFLSIFGIDLGDLRLGLVPGIYNAVITSFYDSLCTGKDSASFLVPEPPMYTIDTKNPTCQSDGEVRIEVDPWLGFRGRNIFFKYDIYSEVTGQFTDNSVLVDTVNPVLVLSNLDPGTVDVYIVDEFGSCGQNEFIILDSDYLSSRTTNVACYDDTTGSIDLDVASITGRETYLWSTGDTTPRISNLSAGTYAVTIIDGVCTQTKEFEIRATSIPVFSSITPADCNGTGGAINLIASGGQGGLNFLWSTGDTTEDLSAVDAGGYSVTVSDSTGCFNREVVLVPLESVCDYEVSGKVYIDANGNCTYDAGETFIRGWVEWGNGRSEYVDLLGEYAFDEVVGNYALTHSFAANSNVSLANCLPAGSHNLAITNTDLSGRDFAYQVVSPVKDLVVYITQSVIRPGFDHRYFIHVENVGTDEVSTDLTFTLDPSVIYLSSSNGGTYDASNQTVTWRLDNVQIGENRRVEVGGNLPPSVPLGTLIALNAATGSGFGDANPADNVFVGTATVVGSFDPNDKLVSTSKISPESPTTQKLTYTIRFQNTGTFPAEFVVIRDTLDETYLLPQTVKPVGASHPYQVSLVDNILEFRFDNIHLPDSARDLEGSNGYVMFDIQTRANLSFGTAIQNRAAIYFDYNKPIITNFARTFVDFSTDRDQSLLKELALFPNPSSGIIYLQGLEGRSFDLSIWNSQGKQVKGVNATKNSQVDLTGLNPGVYVLEIEVNGLHWYSKLALIP